MNDAPLLLALLAIRFFFLREGHPTPARRIFPKALVEIAAILFLSNHHAEPGALAFLLPLVLIAGNLWLWRAEKTAEAPGVRVLSLLALLAIFVIGDPYQAGRLVDELPGVPLLIGISALLALKEGNYLIRWFFQRHDLASKIEDLPATNNGRLIGDLERLLLLVFLWQAVPVAAPIIVAVKGLARFKQMEDAAFAEYVIIGTFLSVLCAFGAWRLALII